jgi:flagellar biosynthesis protein FlhF
MLAVAATCGRAEFAAVVERFSILPLEHVAVTKLDECAAPGRLYGCLRRHQLSPAWFTTGQEVPSDISAASAEMLVERLFAAAAVAA